MQHFSRFGLSEQRQQINGQLFAGSEYRIKKYEKFRHILPAKVGYFPFTYEGEVYSLDQYQAESANGDSLEFVNEADGNPDKLYLDIGCGLRLQHRENILYVEVYPSLSADLIIPPTCLYPIADESLDGIGCFAVLEHTRKPWLVVEEMQRMLKPGGRVFIDWPFLQPVHGYPSHYYNATREGLVAIFVDNGFDINVAKTGPHQTPDHTITWILSHLLDALPDPQRKKLGKMPLEEVARIPVGDKFWREMLSYLPDDAISKFSCGNHLVATKR